MPKRLAITISGAVSLGCYEAGVLYEVINAIGQHNLDPDTSDDEKILIDVITGASAGGMTATIAAQKLLFEASALQSPYANSFYRPWVADIDIRGLLQPHPDDDPTQSILSSGAVVEISHRYLTQRYQGHQDPSREMHPAADGQLALGLAMSNLNGIDYGVPLHSQSGMPADQRKNFVYTRHQDQLTISLNADDPADDAIDLWDPLRNTAVSCGAFPMAFRVVDVIRHAPEYAEFNPITKISAAQSFSYTDGGVFQNEPLGMAKWLVDRRFNHLGNDNRFYLFVAPGSKSSVADAGFSRRVADYTQTLERLGLAIFGQARFQDWVSAEQINGNIRLFNSRAAGLAKLLSPESSHFIERAAKLQAAADELLPALFPGQAGQASLKEKARSRLKEQFAADYKSLPLETRDAWIDSILTLEAAAGIEEQDEMMIYPVTADDSELASSELFAFAGFFDRKYRDHDYDVGRQKARAFLLNPGGLGPIRFTPDKIRDIDKSLDGLKLDQMDRGIREMVRDRVRSRAHEILKQAGIDPFLVGGAVREAIDLAFIKPQLDKILKL